MISFTKVFCLALVVGVLTAGTSMAQKIGVVDGNTVLAEYQGYKDADAKIRNLAQSYNDTVTQMMTKLRETTEKYQKTFETMTKEAQQKAQQEVSAMEQEANKYFQDHLSTNNPQSSVIVERNKALEPILAKIRSVIEQTAKKKGIDIVIDSKQTAIFVSDKVMDITKDVQSALK
jgi:outer membrane protein